MKLTKWALFISGTGSNMQALLDLACDIKPTLVVSNKPQAPGLGKARRMGVSTYVVQNPIDWVNLNQQLKNLGIQKIFLLGFMKILPESFITQWQNEIFNLHPSLLPSYPGLQAFEKAYQDLSPLGATVHRVVAQVDAGPISRQKKFSYHENFQECRLHLSWAEQSLVREVFLNESF
jgi:phosphoribosylglycinamide formyltransferase-1